MFYLPYALRFIMLLLSLFLLLPLLNGNTVLAGDHLDGSITLSHGIADIADIYAFPSPEAKQANHLILAMNVSPFASRSAHFAERMQYNFIIRQLTLQKKEGGTQLKSHDQKKISCTFITPKDSTHTHQISCVTDTGLSVNNKIDDLQGGVSNAGFKVFAGRRSDPFFANVLWGYKIGRKGKIPPPEDDNTFIAMNTLSIVLSIDVNKLYPSQTPALLAIHAETKTQDNPQTAWRQLDRMGRTDITNITLFNKEDKRDQYNLEDTYHLNPKNLAVYRQAMLENINYYDQLDQRQDWSEENKQTLVNYLLDDFLMLDMSKPCQFGKEYLNIETALLTNKQHSSCGGRHFNDDIIDRMLTLYVNANKGNIIADGVNQPAMTLNPTFPYLRTPDDGSFAAFKALLIRTVAKWWL